ncbi:MAG: nitroreductase family protein [Deltaproteobacteria bacterium]|nr:nitroreductase family protein [Deltaproteobacteria bacterium]
MDAKVVDELLTTTRAVRRRLDFGRSVERETVLDCIRQAQQAPTGGNAQGWRWIVVDDAATRTALADIYRRAGEDYLKQSVANAADDQSRRVYSSALFLVDRMAEAPIHVVPCIEGSVPKNATNAQLAGMYGSIYPAVWSFQLALRARGLGTVLTTLHLILEKEAGELLGVPDNVLQVGLLPVAHTTGGEWNPAARPPVDSIVHIDRWR